MRVGGRAQGRPPDRDTAGAISRLDTLAWGTPAGTGRGARPQTASDDPAVTAVVSYGGWLVGAPGLRLHYGFDGWEHGPHEVALEPTGSGRAAAEVPAVAGHLTLEAVVTDGEQWDDNYGADFRLWIGLDPVDPHLHASRPGLGKRRAASLEAAMRSAGIRTGVVSWHDNRFIDGLVRHSPGLHGLVWVHPHRTPLEDVRRGLASGHRGLKLHPSFDRYPADDPALDPYVRTAAEADLPVAVHSAPGHSDPDLIRRLVERHPEVTFVLYHTYMGPYEGRERAVRHAHDLPNLVLETSWCVWEQARWMVEEIGPDRVLFGSDAAVDGTHHYVNHNVEGRQSYNDGLLALARALGPDATRKVLRDTARRAFRLDGGR